MTKVRWISKQWSRFDLTLTKLSRPLTAVNTISNLSVALMVGIFVFGLLFIFGFLGILLLGYFLHKSGFFMETINETFEQQQKRLYEKQIRFLSASVAKCNKMSTEELDEELREAIEGLRL